MTNPCVIVAIPSDSDPVWQVSSEKVPHITLLYLGDDIAADDSRISMVLGEMAMAVSSCGSSIGLPVSTRGTLGPDNADVVFFDPEFTRKLDRLRSRMLNSPTIRGMYNEQKQFPTWQPYLTLGYPATPARIGSDPLRYVVFDRVAVWPGAYDGPTLRLPQGDMPDLNCEDSIDAAWAETVGEFLAHFGVKGQKWRKHKPPMTDAPQQNSTFTKSDGKGPNLPLKNKKYDPSAPKGDKAWADRQLSSGKLQQMQQEAHNAFRKRFKEMLTEPRFAGVAKLLKDPANKGNPKLKKFFAAAKKEHDAIWDRHAKATFGPSPSKGYSISVQRNSDGTVSAGLVKNKKPAPGKFTKKVAHTDDLAADFLAHFGIRGMRWGVRRDRGPAGTVESAVESGHVVSHPSGNHGGSSSAVDQLSTKEIQEAVSRAQAIATYNKLFNPTVSGHTELQTRVDQLRLQAEAARLQRELRPPKPAEKTAIQKLISTSATGFKVFQQVDKVLQGNLSAGLTNKLGLSPHQTPLERLKQSTLETKARRENIKAEKDLTELMALQESLANYDQPSKAQAFGGKHSSVGRHKFG